MILEERIPEVYALAHLCFPAHTNTCMLALSQRAKAGLEGVGWRYESLPQTSASSVSQQLLAAMWTMGLWRLGNWHVFLPPVCHHEKIYAMSWAKNNLFFQFFSLPFRGHLAHTVMCVCPPGLLFLSRSPRDRANFYMIPPYPFHNYPVCVPVVFSRQVLARRAQQVDLILFCHHLRNLQSFCKKGTKPQPPRTVFINLRQSKATTRAATVSAPSFLPKRLSVSCCPVPSALDSVRLQQGQSLTEI